MISLVRIISVARRHFTRILVLPAATFDFLIFPTDAKNDYLRSKENFQREIYVQPYKEFELNDGNMKTFLKHLNGLSESSEYLKNVYRKHF